MENESGTMQFLDLEGCRGWARDHNVTLTSRGWPVTIRELALPVVRFGLPSPVYRTTWFSQYLSVVLPGAAESLLWVTEWGIWPSSENWHLYRHLRQSYGNGNSVEQAPGHLFSSAERDDLATFLQVGILFGWDMNLLAFPDRARLFVSHDEFVAIASADTGLLACCRAELGSGGITPLAEESP
jgi:hypothetical protein